MLPKNLKTYNLQAKKGFTLIELIIYLAVFSGVTLGLVYFTLSINNSRSKTYVAQEVHANGRTALDLISQRIRAANGVVSVTSSVLTLDFSTANPAKHPTAIDRDINNALRITEGTPPIVTTLTSNKVSVTGLTFTNLTGTGARENIRVDLTVEYANTSGDPRFTYSKSWTTAVSVRQ